MPDVFKDYVKNKNSRPGPLKGVRVLEVCTLLFGPAGPSFMAALGAEVIKIELPSHGRRYPFAESLRLVLQRTGTHVHAHQYL
jgi:crotonobetainyl-CoA:carnitine CoA-transferase CaiB-like acyl-CoA transferase